MKDNQDLNPNNRKKSSKRKINIIIAVLFLILAASILNYYTTKLKSQTNNVTNAIKQNTSTSTNETPK